MLTDNEALPKDNEALPIDNGALSMGAEASSMGNGMLSIDDRARSTDNMTPNAGSAMRLAGALLHSKLLEGYWFDRTMTMEYATREEPVLSPLPCWKHLSLEQYRERVAGLVEQIESESRLLGEPLGDLGLDLILGKDLSFALKKRPVK